MERQPVTSSNIRGIGYDPKSQILEIEFHGSGIYQYFKVPQTVYNALMTASSHGSYFAHYIRKQYRWKKIQ
jgi:hypothetical protein